MNELSVGCAVRTINVGTVIQWCAWRTLPDTSAHGAPYQIPGTGKQETTFSRCISTGDFQVIVVELD